MWDYDKSFNSWIDEKDIKYKMSQYFPKPYRHFGGNVKVELDLSSYATGVDATKLAAKSDLFSLKSEVVKIDVDKWKTLPVHLSKLSK